MSAIPSSCSLHEKLQTHYVGSPIGFFNPAIPDKISLNPVIPTAVLAQSRSRPGHNVFFKPLCVTKKGIFSWMQIPTAINLSTDLCMHSFWSREKLKLAVRLFLLFLLNHNDDNKVSRESRQSVSRDFRFRSKCGEISLLSFDFDHEGNYSNLPNRGFLIIRSRLN